MNARPTLQRIIEGGYCIGCGACAAMAPDRIKMQFDRHGMLQPVITGAGLDESTDADVLKVCPFSDDGMHEDQLADALFPGVVKDDRIGGYQGLYVGYVAEGSFRTKGSSGGVISWILAELLRTGNVDGVIHVAPSAHRGDRLFAYRISTGLDEVLQGAKSKYYPIELSDVLNQVQSQEGRYVLVGVPCFIKAVRRMAMQNAAIRERIVFYVGLVCGHLKSKAFADCIGWQAGITPGRLEAVDFRVKLPQRQASEYGVTVRGDGIEKTAPTGLYFGTNWGYGFFKYSACEYCDDVFAETADIAVGDAWLPEFDADSEGNSVVISRSTEADDLLRAAWEEGRLNLRECSVESMAESQAGGLRHRRDGLACRLSIKQARNEWAPAKRVTPSVSGLSARRKKIYLLREVLRAQSHELWLESVQAGTFSTFRVGMEGLIRRYRRTYAPFHSRLAGRVRRMLGIKAADRVG